MLSFATVWVNLESIVLREISQTQKGKHHTIPLTSKNLEELNSEMESGVVVARAGWVGERNGKMLGKADTSLP